MRQLATVFLLLTAACVTTGQMFVPMDSTVRAPKQLASVVLLDKEPDRAYTTIGIISPPPDEYDSVAEALNAARRIAAKKGADAIIVESMDQSSQTGFDVGFLGAKSTTGVLVNVRIKAIVWKK